MREIDPAMDMSPRDGMRRFRIEDAIDDVLIAEVGESTADSHADETTLQRLCRELNIEYTDMMRAQEEKLQKLAELGRTGARLAALRDTIEQFYQIPTQYRSY